MKKQRMGMLLGSLALLMTVALAACGNESTAVSGAGTAVSSAGTAVANTGVGTAASSAVTQAATAASGAATQAATVAANVNQATVSSAGTAASGAVQTASNVKPALTPAPTVSGATGNAANTPGAMANGMVMYPGAQELTLSTAQQNQILPALSNLRSVIDQATVKTYRVTGVTDSTKINDYYRSQLTSAGWTDQTNNLNAITAVTGNLSFYGNKALAFTKGNQIMMVGVSAPMTAEAINTLGVGTAFKPGDIGIMTVSGTPKLPLQ